jgi:coenzyme Q-binding protein COQ10
LPSFKTQRRVPFTPEQMFAVVSDVERYPEFLPLCTALSVKSRTAEASKTTLVATMTVGYGKISERFTTRVTLEPEVPLVRVSHVDGPFTRLENEWRFVAVPGGCEVRFVIDYAFRSPMLQMIVGAAFDKAVRSYTEAFEARARTLYGSRTTA